MTDPAHRRLKAGAAWQAQVAAEVERGVALPGPAERLRA